MRKKTSKRRGISPRKPSTSATPIENKKGIVPGYDATEIAPRGVESAPEHSRNAPKFFTIDQIAELLQLDTDTVCRLLKSARL